MASDLSRVPESELDQFNPDRFDAIANDDGTYRLVAIPWWDDSSYAAWQGDPYAALYDDMEPCDG